MKHIIKLYKYISDERNRLIGVTLLSVALSSIGIVTPLFFRYVIDQLTAVVTNTAQGNVAEKIIIVLVILGALQFVGNIFDFIRERVSDRMSIDIEVKLRQRIFERMLSLSIDYYEQTRVGETLVKTQNGLYQFNFWLKNLAEGLLSQLIVVVMATALLYYIDPLIGAIVTVLTGLGITIQVIRIRQSRKVRTEVRQYDEQSGGYLSETISHITTVKTSIPNKVATTKFTGLLMNYRGAVNKMNNVQQYGNLARGLVSDLAIVLGVAIIAWDAVHGKASAGDVVAVALYLQQITNGTGPLGRFIVSTSEVESSVERIITLLETEPTVVDTPTARQLTEIKSIEFKDVSFHYPGKERKVLNSISFEIKPGHTVALVGPSGTGKTTVTKLLLRFYEPTSGLILINGEPIEHFTGESIRQHIGMVMQEVALFNESIGDNLTPAAPEADQEAIEAAATQAHAQSFIETLPEGYNTMVGERGVKLSGGEKQRVAVARAILKDPDLIILDEATSALDSESEQHVQAGLQKLMKGRTSVVIAHRLSTIMKADEILVMQKGEIIERGVHSDLTKQQGGLYAKLYALQTEGIIAK